jgi:hypothetical protein
VASAQCLRRDQLIGETVKFTAGDGKYAIVIEDDGRVGYAYLMDSRGEICGDVWLYNRCPAPDLPEWHDPSGAPFANPLAYVRSCTEFPFPNSSADIEIDWAREDGECLARIFIQKELVAVVKNGAKPGWALLAKKDGPLAKALNEARGAD